MTVKLIFCLMRLPSLTRGEFHEYWRNVHAPKVLQHANVLGMRKYVQSHSFEDARLAPIIAARGGEVPTYDGIAECWFDSVDEIVRVGASPEARAAGRELLEDERRFIDLPRSPQFFTHEHILRHRWVAPAETTGR